MIICVPWSMNITHLNINIKIKISVLYNEYVNTKFIQTWERVWLKIIKFFSLNQNQEVDGYEEVYIFGNI